jgi:hypothetical protein
LPKCRENLKAKARRRRRELATVQRRIKQSCWRAFDAINALQWQLNQSVLAAADSVMAQRTRGVIEILVS